ncbi:MAG: hypothetical protein KME09_15275 [Pleurocapsa minor HA4230-MV1]|jgi:hypothetical protein|nr:hypothetical protein [Pleurocapsa minor HA4230-MV1]
MTTIAPELKRQWKAIAPYLTISNEQEYDEAEERLNVLLTEYDKHHKLCNVLNGNQK